MIISKVKDLTGKRFGKLKVLKRSEDHISPSGKHRIMWLCKCDCGTERAFIGENLRSGKSTSCGCIGAEKLSKMTKTHGESNSRLYGVWYSMRNRCNNPNNKEYSYYGGRGIRVDDIWNSSYEAFRDWAYANGYTEHVSLDRIDNNKNYGPDNCRWVDSVAQANNRRSNRLYTYNGETHNTTEWARIVGMNPRKLFCRIYLGWDFEKAITTL